MLPPKTIWISSLRISQTIVAAAVWADVPCTGDKKQIIMKDDKNTILSSSYPRIYWLERIESPYASCSSRGVRAVGTMEKAENATLLVGVQNDSMRVHKNTGHDLKLTTLKVD